MKDPIDRQAAIDAIDVIPWYHQNKNGEMVHGASDKEQAWYKTEDIYKAIESVPPAQPGQRNARVFQGIVVEYLTISTYPEYEGKPYFSIKYTENGQEFIGYGTYKPEVLSEYLKEYFMCGKGDRMSDLIDRQAAIDAAIEAADDWDGGTNIGRQKRIEKYINALPSAQPVEDIHREKEQAYYCGYEDGAKSARSVQPGWIPCTPETMPEREGRYVCTYTYDGKKDVFMFRYEDGQFLVPWYVETVTAWYKPLDPWEGGQS